MEQGKQHTAHGCSGRPVLGRQQRAKLRQRGDGDESGSGCIEHQRRGQHDLVGRCAEQKGQQHLAVEPEEAAERFERIC